MQTTTIEYPEEVRLSLNLSQEAFMSEIRMAAAVKLFELGRLSSGRAAELAGLSRIQFLHTLDAYAVATFAMEADELEQDIVNARLS